MEKLSTKIFKGPNNFVLLIKIASILKVKNHITLSSNPLIIDSMTIPIPKESMACLQTSKSKFMINDILSSSESNNNNNHSPSNNGSSVNSSPTHHNHHHLSHFSQHQLQHQQQQQNGEKSSAAVTAAAMHAAHHLPHHLLQLQREQFAAAAAANGRISSPEYDDGASDCDSEDIMDDNSVCSNGRYCDIIVLVNLYCVRKI